MINGSNNPKGTYGTSDLTVEKNRSSGPDHQYVKVRTFFENGCFTFSLRLKKETVKDLDLPVLLTLYTKGVGGGSRSFVYMMNRVRMSTKQEELI